MTGLRENAGALSPTGEAPMVLHVRVMAGTGGGPEKTILRSPKYADPNRYRMAIAYIHPPDDPGIETIRARRPSRAAASTASPTAARWTCTRCASCANSPRG